MQRFDLTPEQEAIAFTCLDAARIARESGSPGVVLAQIKCDGSETYCAMNFIPAGYADRIVAILLEWYEEASGDHRMTPETLISTLAECRGETKALICSKKIKCREAYQALLVCEEIKNTLLNADKILEGFEYGRS